MSVERPPALSALEALAAQLGADPELVQGAGGNVSLEDGGLLWVTGSGTWLSEALLRPTFLALDVGDVRGALARDAAALDPRALTRRDASGTMRPSIETPLHALMPQRVVLHLHSVRTLAFAVQSAAHDHLADRLRGVPWGFVPYRQPGVPLTRAVADVIEAAVQAPDVLVLQNHGLVVAGPDVQSAAELLRSVEARLDGPSRPPPPPQLDALNAWMSMDASGAWRLPAEPCVHGLGTDPVSYQAFSRGVLYPDHAVFLGDGWPSASLSEPLTSSFHRHHERSGRAPRFLVLEGVGVVVDAAIPRGAEAMLGCAARVGARLPADVAVRPLDPRDVGALTEWEAERYRSQLDQAAPSP
ncbi:MAG: class II aldolase/adducin family protein [Polyangiales bacterium]